MNMRLHLSATSLAALALASAATAQQQSIYVDFSDHVFGVSGTPSSAFGAAVGTPGAWNDIDVNLSVGGLLMTGPLNGANGAVTTVTLEADGAGFNLGGVDFDIAAASGDDAALLEDIGWFDGPGTFTFAGLNPGTYDVYTYAMAPDDVTAETSVDVVGSGSGVQYVGGDFQGTYQQGLTHALHTVTVGTAGTIVIQTDVFTLYDSIAGFQIVPAGAGGGLGSVFCSSTVNSSGAIGSIGAIGSTVVAANDVTLQAGNLPAGQFGIFLTSMTQASVPVGNGTLCLGGQIGRYTMLSQILQANAAGEFELAIDLNQTPQGAGFVPIAAGETWNFQAWFRDVPAGGSGSNFTDGYSIDFQ